MRGSGRRIDGPLYNPAWRPGRWSVILFIGLAIVAHLTGWGDELPREVFR